MFLTATNIIHYLLATGFVSTEDLLAEDFRLIEVGRRNRNFKIFRPKSTSLFVKQVPMAHAETIGSFQREATSSRLGQDAKAGSILKAVMPTLLRYDPQRHVLIYEVLEGAESLGVRAQRDRDFSPATAAALGRILALCHLEPVLTEAPPETLAVFPRQPPWVFRMGTDAETVMPNMSEGRRRAIDVLRRTPELYHGLEQMCGQWRRVCLIHGDMKFENVMALGTGRDEASLRLIDWELADIGEPLWDVAGILTAYFQAWLLSLPSLPGPFNPDAMMRQAPFPLTAVHPGADAFWRAYTTAAGIAAPFLADALARTVQLAGARLVLLAVELLPSSTELTPPAELALWLARLCIANPAWAALNLLGVSPPGMAAPHAAPDATGTGRNPMTAEGVSR